MKTTKPTDPFELTPCIHGMTTFITYAYTQILNFCYALTFKKSLKALAHEFKDPEENPINDVEFFQDIDDPIVRNGYSSATLLINYIYPFLLRYNLDHEEIMDLNLNDEAKRYAPTFITYLRGKSYLQTSLAYQRFLEELSNTFYHYACALSLNSYQIPVHMRTSLNYTPQGSFKWLNSDHYEVQSLIELIEALQKIEAELKEIITRKR